MNFILYLILFTIPVLKVKGLALCPNPYIDISPCVCIEKEVGVTQSAIQCFGDQNLDLIQVFEILDANIGPKNKDFHTFYLNNTFVDEIPEKVFKDFTFEEIFIEKTNNLLKISQNSLNGLEESVKHLHIKDTKLSLNSENFTDIQAFDSLKNLQFLDFSWSECPPKHLLGPKCKCDLVSEYESNNLVNKPKLLAIVCTHVLNSEELFTVFDGLNTHLTGNERNFFRFHLKESNISELKSNLFDGIAFSEVVLQDCPQLNQIDRNVFMTVEPFINHLSIKNIDLKNDSNIEEDLWYAISSLSNLVSLDLVNVFDEIPVKAFKSAGTQHQWRLKSFTHSGYETNLLRSKGHRIKRIGRYAFNNLPKIELINLQNNLIGSIDKYSFANQMSSEIPLKIRLGRNKLNHNSFAVGSFAGSQRPINLELGQLFMGCNRDILYLEESVFSPFLDKEANQLDMGCAFVMQCDCHMKWLYDGPDFWRFKIKTGNFGDTVIPCEVDSEESVEEISIWDLPQDYFQCNSQKSLVKNETTYGLEVNNTVENEVQEFIDDALDLMA